MPCRTVFLRSCFGPNARAAGATFVIPNYDTSTLSCGKATLPCLDAVHRSMAQKNHYQSCGRAANSVTSRFVSRSGWASRSRKGRRTHHFASFLIFPRRLSGRARLRAQVIKINPCRHSAGAVSGVGKTCAAVCRPRSPRVRFGEKCAASLKMPLSAAVGFEPDVQDKIRVC